MYRLWQTFMSSPEDSAHRTDSSFLNGDVERMNGLVPTTEVLSQRRLNRAMLERQLLLQRHPRSVQQDVEHMGGL